MHQDNFSPLLTDEQNNRLKEIAEAFSVSGITNDAPYYVYERLLNIVSPSSSDLISLLRKLENIPELNLNASSSYLSISSKSTIRKGEQ